MRRKILCVDDEIQILNILSRLLESEGFEVKKAINADEFQKTAPEFQPDLIILDIMLGDKNGVQVYDDLIAKGFDKKVPVIFLSGLVQESMKSPASPGRTYALLAKPFKHDELIRQINTLLGA